MIMQRDIEVRATRAIERRFGVTASTYTYRWANPKLLKIIDCETGSWITCRMNGTRLQVLDEFDSQN